MPVLVSVPIHIAVPVPLLFPVPVPVPVPIPVPIPDSGFRLFQTPSQHTLHVRSRKFLGQLNLRSLQTDLFFWATL